MSADIDTHTRDEFFSFIFFDESMNENWFPFRRLGSADVCKCANYIRLSAKRKLRRMRKEELSTIDMQAPMSAQFDCK